MGYNSPYSDFRFYGPLAGKEWINLDVEVKDSAVPYRQEKIESWRDGRPVCHSCFYGIHAHAPRKAGSVSIEDNMDCKVLLLDDEGKQVGQCCCTWSEGERRWP